MRNKVIGSLAVVGLVLATGVAGTATASAAQAGKPCGNYTSSEPTLSYGSSGIAVEALQCELNWDMNNTTDLNIDGSWGDQTQAAVIKFQQCAGLQPVDGIVGPQTWSKLDYWASSQYYVC
ncbi:peptidoglycan-binding domain-containing protein [Streptomyces sp. NPDC001393]